MNKLTRITSVAAIAAIGAITTLAATSVAENNAPLRGTVRIDGSSTVFPITEAVAEEFTKEQRRVRVPVGVSGTGGGFKRFVVGETDISNASRFIKAKEYELCKENGIDFIEVPVAYDGLSVVVNTRNYWIDQMTVDELRKIFLEENAATRWSQVRDGWPDIEIDVFAPGTDSGTFDYFKEVMDGDIRPDMQVSEDDNVLVNGVTGSEGAIGFFGAAYYFENADKLKIVPIVNSQGEAVTPSNKTIEEGTYEPFSRPLLIYVNAKSLNRPEVAAFVEFYLNNTAELAEEVGYVRLPQKFYDIAERKIAARQTGTHFLDSNMNKVEGGLAKNYK
jgi:phosphate transport system substrate-binding protein